MALTVATGGASLETLSCEATRNAKGGLTAKCSCWSPRRPLRIEAEFTNRPVLVADSVTSVEDNAAVMMTFDRTGNTAAANRGQAGQSSTAQSGQSTAQTGQTTGAQSKQPMIDVRRAHTHD
jgi:hypothetical protein